MTTLKQIVGVQEKQSLKTIQGSNHEPEHIRTIKSTQGKTQLTILCLKTSEKNLRTINDFLYLSILNVLSLRSKNVVVR